MKLSHASFFCIFILLGSHSYGQQFVLDKANISGDYGVGFDGEYQYSEESQLEVVENDSYINSFSYPNDTLTLIEVWDKSSESKIKDIELHHNQNQSIQKYVMSSYDGNSTSFDHVEYYEYDETGRLISKSHLDGYRFMGNTYLDEDRRIEYYYDDMGKLIESKESYYYSFVTETINSKFEYFSNGSLNKITKEHTSDYFDLLDTIQYFYLNDTIDYLIEEIYENSVLAQRDSCDYFYDDNEYKIITHTLVSSWFEGISKIEEFKQVNLPLYSQKTHSLEEFNQETSIFKFEELTIDSSDFHEGSYFINNTANYEINQDFFIDRVYQKQHYIVDSLKKLVIVDPSELATKIFPSPLFLGEPLTIQTDFKWDEYNLIDSQGSLIQTGINEKQQSAITIHPRLQLGLYYIILIDNSTHVSIASKIIVID